MIISRVHAAAWAVCHNDLLLDKLQRHTYDLIFDRSFVVPPLGGGVGPGRNFKNRLKAELRTGVPEQRPTPLQPVFGTGHSRHNIVRRHPTAAYPKGVNRFMDYLDLMLRLIHIISVVLLVGGTFFLRFVWWPSTSQMDAEQREAAFAALRKPWSMIVMLTTLLLLISGLANAVRFIVRYEFIGAPYHVLVLAKLVLALVMFFLAARIAGRSNAAVKARQNIGQWLTINTVIALLLISIAGYMKLVERVPKPPKIEAAQASNCDPQLHGLKIGM